MSLFQRLFQIGQSEAHAIVNGLPVTVVRAEPPSIAPATVRQCLEEEQWQNRAAVGAPPAVR